LREFFGEFSPSIGKIMSSNAHTLKASMRRQLRANFSAMSATQRAAWSQEICSVLAVQPIWREARSILSYFPTEQEPDISPLLNQALAEGRSVCLPRQDSNGKAYGARQIQNLGSDLEVGAFSIREPRGSCPVFPLNQLDLALAPGVGFDLTGWRLGRGKGYYDRLLAQVSGHKCGVAFEWQIVKEIPWEPHDVRLNSILTPSRWQVVVS